MRFSRFDLLEMVYGAEGSLNALWSGLCRVILSPARLPFHHSGTRDIDNERVPGMQEHRMSERTWACRLEE
jgi:hypothetical protein